MCQGHVSRSKLKVLRVLNAELKLENVESAELKSKHDDCDKTFRSVSTVSSFESEVPLVRSCLKIKTQEESVQKDFSSSMEDKSVNFSTLEIKSFPRRLGDNPSTTSGPALTIAWDAESTTTVEVEEYEATRGERRSLKDLRIPGYKRQAWLHEEGVTLKEVKEAHAKTLQIQRERFDSVDESLVVAEYKDLIKRKFKKWLLHTPSDKQLFTKWKQEQEITVITTNQGITAITTKTTNQVIECSA